MEMEWKQLQPQEENSSFDVLGEFQGEPAHMMMEQQQILYDELLTPLEHLKTSSFCSSAESDMDSLLLDHVLDSVTLHSSASGCLSMQEDSEMDMDWFSEFETSEQDPNSEQLLNVNNTTTGDHQTPSNEQQQKRNEEQEQEANPLPTLSSEMPCRARSKRRCHVRLPTPEAAAQEAPDIYATISEAELQCALKMMNGMHRKNKRKSGNPRRHSNSKAGQRRCSHCSTQKTPQWRMGPLGPKTLCNACGVRFMSGRLYPEYRPAKSPTFISLLHSNCHRRVLQIRAGLFPFRIVPNPATGASSSSASSPSESQLPDLS